MRYALIENNKVKNVILADEEFISNMTETFQHIEALDNHPLGNKISAGWGWDPSGFTEPPVPPEAPVERKVTRLAFLNRFTDAEAIALDLASIGTTIEAASIRRYMQKVHAATFIDLGREDTISGVNQLEAVGLIGPGRAEVILTAPITDLERAK